jgi:hypothetical protein
VDSTQFSASGAQALPKGCSLIATGDKLTPAGFNQKLNLTPSSPEMIPVNPISLWAWEGRAGRLAVLRPQLAAQQLAGHLHPGQGVSALWQQDHDSQYRVLGE